MRGLTVIVVPDEAGAVRRYYLPRRLIDHGPWFALVVAVLVVIGSIDYVRLRLNALDVGRLRQQAAQYRGELDTLADGLASLEEEFGRLWEFEHKVRVIADLPGAMVEAAVPESSTAGQGGGLEGSEPSTTASEAETSAEPETPAVGGRGRGRPSALFNRGGRQHRQR